MYQIEYSICSWRVDQSAWPIHFTRYVPSCAKKKKKIRRQPLESPDPGFGRKGADHSESFLADPIKQQSLPNRPFWLGDHLCRVTVLLPRSFSFDVAVSYPLSITSHHRLQKWVDYVTIQQRVADGNSIHDVFSR